MAQQRMKGEQECRGHLVEMSLRTEEVEEMVQGEKAAEVNSTTN